MQIYLKDLNKITTGDQFLVKVHLISCIILQNPYRIDDVTPSFTLKKDQSQMESCPWPSYMRERRT